MALCEHASEVHNSMCVSMCTNGLYELCDEYIKFRKASRHHEVDSFDTNCRRDERFMKIRFKSVAIIQEGNSVCTPCRGYY